MTSRPVRRRWVLPGVLALLGALSLAHAPCAGSLSRAGVGWCPAAGTAPMPVACVPRP